MKISIQELYDADQKLYDATDEYFVDRLVTDNPTYRNYLMYVLYVLYVFDFNEDVYGEFNHIHESWLYHLKKSQEDINLETLFQGIIKFFLERYFYDLPNTSITLDVWENLEDVSNQFDLISEVFNAHKDNINDPEQFFLSVFKDLILSEELARIVTLDEDKLKKEPYFKKAMASYNPLKEISFIFYEEILKLYQSKES